jgi:hypothetical protein
VSPPQDVKPTAQDLALVAAELLKTKDAAANALGNSLQVAQDQLGKSGEQAAADLSALASYPTYQDDTPVPPGTTFVVGMNVGGNDVKNVQPGDNVKKGDIIKSSSPIAVKGGMVYAVDMSIFKKAAAVATSKTGMGMGAVLLLVAAGGGYLWWKNRQAQIQ